VTSASRERPLSQLSRMAATPIVKAFCVLELAETLLLSHSGILEHDMVNLQLRVSPSTTGVRNFRILVVYAKGKVLADHLYQRNKWIMFVRPTRAALTSRQHVPV
jgi:hypothetical protein